MSAQPTNAALAPLKLESTQCLRVDRGQARSVIRQYPSNGLMLAAICRSGSLSVAGHGSYWLIVRGGAILECQEGRFPLRAGEWISLDPDSNSRIYAGRTALVLAFLLPAPVGSDQAIYSGRGRSTAYACRMALQLWRRAGVFGLAMGATDPIDPDVLARISQLVSGMQEQFEVLLSRCPGRSLRRRRVVLARMQRARLYLDGHLSRNVRLAELAQLTTYSTWYFTKTFHAVYGKGPRKLVSRLRLRRASTLLAQTQMSIAEVGEACGFENPCSFARAFRARYGVTASLYRRSNDRA